MTITTAFNFLFNQPINLELHHVQAGPCKNELWRTIDAGLLQAFPAAPPTELKGCTIN